MPVYSFHMHTPMEWNYINMCVYLAQPFIFGILKFFFDLLVYSGFLGSSPTCRSLIHTFLMVYTLPMQYFAWYIHCLCNILHSYKITTSILYHVTTDMHLLLYSVMFFYLLISYHSYTYL